MKFVATLITIVLNSKQPTCSPTEGVSAWWGLSQGKAQEGGRGNLKAPTGTGDRHKAYAEQKEPDAKDRAPCDSIDRKFKNRQKTKLGIGSQAGSHFGEDSSEPQAGSGGLSLSWELP